MKENDLTHGQFTNWVKTQGIDVREAQRMMKISKELPNTTTWSHLGSRVLYLITTLPEEEKQEQIEKIEQGDNSTSTVPLYLALSPKLDNVVQLRPRGRIR